MRKIILGFLFVLSGFMVGCSGDDASALPSDPQTLVKKMTVKNFNGQSEPQMTGVFEFIYNEDNEVTSIQKTVTATSGDVVESSVYTYDYHTNKIFSFSDGFTGPTSVLYNANDQILNIGSSSELEYYPNGQLKKNGYGIVLLYNGNNQTGTSDSPNIYQYDLGKNPFTNHNPYFRLIFEEQFQAYYSDDNFRAENNIVSENMSSVTLHHEITYDSDNFPILILMKNSNSPAVLEEMSFEYITL